MPKPANPLNMDPDVPEELVPSVGAADAELPEAPELAAKLGIENPDDEDEGAAGTGLGFGNSSGGRRCGSRPSSAVLTGAS